MIVTTLIFHSAFALSMSAIEIYRQPLTNGLSDHVWSLEEIALLAN
jgi:hypothetical protein